MGVKIKDIPKEDRPCERLIEYGVESLSNEDEIREIVIEVLMEKGISLEYSSGVARVVADGSFSEKYGARNMRRLIEP